MIIKQKPEDFIVEEIPEQEPKTTGKYYLIKITKKGLNTQDATRIIAKKLGIKEKEIKYAGNKDKQAITTQYMTIKKKPGLKKEKINQLKKITLNEQQEITIKLEGETNEPLSLGSLKGNKFTITIRGLNKEQEIKKKTTIPNYFDEQRFSKNNDEIGKAIIKKEFKKACELIIKNGGRQARIITEELNKNPNNFVGALRRIEKKTLMLYVHAYQSKIFNEQLRIIEEKQQKEQRERKETEEEITKKELPIIGFDTKEDEEIKKILTKEGISTKDFIIREIPELTMEGTTRKAYIKIKNLNIKKEEDELNPGKQKIIMTFELPKGAYATNAIKQIIKK